LFSNRGWARIKGALIIGFLSKTKISCKIKGSFTLFLGFNQTEVTSKLAHTTFIRVFIVLYFFFLSYHQFYL